MKKIGNSIMMILTAVCLMFAFSAHARENNMPSLAAMYTESCRIITGCDVVIVSDAAVQGVDDTADRGKRGLICTGYLTGQDIFDLIATKLSEGGESYPCFSGVRAEIKVLSDGGGRRESLEGLFCGDENMPIDFEAKYEVALSGDYVSAYINRGEWTEHTPDISLLREFVDSFDSGASDKNTKKGGQQSSINQKDEGDATLQNQTAILYSALSLAAVALAVYLIIWRSRKNKGDGSKSL